MGIAKNKPDFIFGLVAGPSPRLSCFRSLPFHGGVKTSQIDIATLAAQHVLGQVQRKPVGVVKTEGDIAGQCFTIAQLVRLVSEKTKTAVQRLTKSGLFQFQCFSHQRLGTNQFRKGLSHNAVQHGHQRMHQWISGADHVGMAHGAAHDTSQNIATAFIRRQDAIRNKKRG